MPGAKQIYDTTRTCGDLDADYVSQLDCNKDEDKSVLAAHAATCCPNGISKCGVPDVCQDPSKFKPKAVEKWLCGTYDELSPIDSCPASCEKKIRVSGGTTFHTCECGVYSVRAELNNEKEECEAKYPGDVAYPKGPPCPTCPCFQVNDSCMLTAPRWILQVPGPTELIFAHKWHPRRGPPKRPVPTVIH